MSNIGEEIKMNILIINNDPDIGYFITDSRNKK